MVLNELKRSDFISSGKRSDNYTVDQSKGRNRYFRRMHSIVEKSTTKLNRLDMNKLFVDGILDINLDVRGETAVYTVRISFGHFLAELHKEVQQQENKFTLPIVIRALIKAFNTDDVLVRCSCPDFMYRISYNLSMDKGIAGEMETRPSDITNPDDTKGRGCKHIQATLSNNSWLQRLGRVIYNYVNYMSQHYQTQYADIIYPAIYEKDYDELYQQSLDILDKNDLDSDENGDKDVIDTANKWAREKDKFKPGTQQGWQFTKNTDTQDDQLSLNLDDQTATITSEPEFDINDQNI